MTKRYRFKIYWEDDDENVWVSASSMPEALSELRSEYPRIRDYVFLGTSD